MSTNSSERIPTTAAPPYRMFEIQPRLYLSRFPRLEIPAQVTHVLNMCTESHPKDPSRTYMQVPILDFDNITPHIDEIVNFIGKALDIGGEGGVVLVHCAMGMNRSVAAIISYLCHSRQINSSEALRIVKAVKPDVDPAKVFMRQIDIFFGREGAEEDPLVGFHRRLEERKKAAGWNEAEVKMCGNST